METLISALMTTYSIGPKRLSKSGTACSLEPGEEALCWELGGGRGMWEPRGCDKGQGPGRSLLRSRCSHPRGRPSLQARLNRASLGYATPSPSTEMDLRLQSPH